MKKKQHLFNYLYSVYEELEGKIKGTQHYETGFFREKNKEDAKKYAREIWNKHPDKTRFILVTNENGKEIVNHSNNGS